MNFNESRDEEFPALVGTIFLFFYRYIWGGFLTF